MFYCKCESLTEVDIKTLACRNARRITAAEMKYMRRTAGYTWTDYKTNSHIAKELEITPVLDKLLEYKRNWIQHVNRMPRDRLPRIMKHYSPTGRRNRGRPLKRLLDTWDRNGSTSGLTPWQTYHDDPCRNVTSCSSADNCHIIRKPLVLKLEAVDSSEPLVPTYQTTRDYITVNWLFGNVFLCITLFRRITHKYFWNGAHLYQHFRI